MKPLAIITGGTKGIGLAIAQKFAAEGFDLLINARSANDLSQTKNKIESSFGNHCEIFQADLSKKNEAKAFCEFALSLERPIQVLVNNTGTFVQGSLMQETDEALETQINTNLYSAYWVTKGLIQTIKESPNSHIFNICSIASLQAYPSSGSYTVSKFALLGFSKSLREELKDDGVKVTSIMPGATYTSSWEGIDLPKSRFIQSEDIAEITWTAYSLSSAALVEDIVIRPLAGDI
ncbi:SDR family oxidoreductase [Marinilongibacter aquaticus]|uniref:SDR family oxidoreductase n=1 Tax=Marinilongibacter aquaticus TaxID=2975157 RepID=UPI0021BD22F7|nr:SDR family oxidoreductase [Marinilongibacter aquaticus]UBM57708.1 SDR family oxidoreductase [Marinilongibacter aquaticus]